MTEQKRESLQKSASWVQDYATVQEIWRLMLWKQVAAKNALSGSQIAEKEYDMVNELIKKLLGIE